MAWDSCTHSCCTHSGGARQSHRPQVVLGRTNPKWHGGAAVSPRPSRPFCASRLAGKPTPLLVPTSPSPSSQRSGCRSCPGSFSPVRTRSATHTQCHAHAVPRTRSAMHTQCTLPCTRHAMHVPGVHVAMLETRPRLTPDYEFTSISQHFHRDANVMGCSVDQGAYSEPYSTRGKCSPAHMYALHTLARSRGGVGWRSVRSTCTHHVCAHHACTHHACTHHAMHTPCTHTPCMHTPCNAHTVPAHTMHAHTMQCTHRACTHHAMHFQAASESTLTGGPTRTASDGCSCTACPTTTRPTSAPPRARPCALGLLRPVTLS